MIGFKLNHVSKRGPWCCLFHCHVHVVFVIVMPLTTAIYNAVPLRGSQFSSKSLQWTSHRLPMMARCGLSIVSLNSSLCSVSVFTVLYASTSFIGQCIKGTRPHVFYETNLSRLHTSKTAILAIWISPQLVLAKFGWFSWTNCFKWKKTVAFKSFHIRVSKPVKCKLDCVFASNNAFFLFIIGAFNRFLYRYGSWI